MAHSYRLPPALLERLRSGAHVSDAEVDVIFPLRYRALSPIQWSPLEVARELARFLEGRGPLKVLDVGSGVGKLCALLGLLFDGEITGVEQRARLVRVAMQVAAENSLAGRVRFVHANMLEHPWEPYDVIYLYNPFQEQREGAEYARMDDTVAYDVKIFEEYTREVQSRLRTLKPGKLVVTYQGFGGPMPPCMRTLHAATIRSTRLLTFHERLPEPEPAHGA